MLVTNIPSPYRVDFFNALGELCELTVCYERPSASDRDVGWSADAARNFGEVYSNSKPFGVDATVGLKIARFVDASRGKEIILTNYHSPSVMLAIAWCRLRRISYSLEYDGGSVKKDSLLKRLVKAFLIGGAKRHFITCEKTRDYLRSIGVAEEKIFKYPFTSLSESDMKNAVAPDADSKLALKSKLGIRETQAVLSVGRFTCDGGYGKGFDTLLEVASKLPTVGFYIVGDSPTDEFVKLKADMRLDNVHYVGFKRKAELAEYYRAADLFALLTRGDVWGLVINEAMAHRLPCVTTDRCIAGLELIEDGVNGRIVEAGDARSAADAVKAILEDDGVRTSFSTLARERVKEYTVESMARVHYGILSGKLR